METLTEHNKRAGDAGVLCDKCGTGMNVDFGTKEMDRRAIGDFRPRGEPVVCPKCGYRGRKHFGW